MKYLNQLFQKFDKYKNPHCKKLFSALLPSHPDQYLLFGIVEINTTGKGETKIMAQTIPIKLYKYLRYNQQNIDGLRQRYLWFSKPENFNDPFDCELLLKLTDKTNENWITLFNFFREDLSLSDKKAFDEKYLRAGKPNKEFKRKFEKESAILATKLVLRKYSQIGIACFSEKKPQDDILMWSHYADGHRGFCLEFDTSFAPFKDSEGEKEWLNAVTYSHSYPILSLTDIINIRQEIYFPFLKFLFTTKSKHWSYEKEWRVFKRVGGESLSIDAAAISGIYFGCAMQSEDKREICRILDGSPTALYEMHRSDTKFKVIPREYKP